MGIGNLELLLVLILALLILGPRRLILLAQVLGKFIGNLRGITETLPQYAEEFLEEDQNSKKPIPSIPSPPEAQPREKGKDVSEGTHTKKPG